LESQELATRHIALRERAGLTQVQEAKKAGVSPTTISGIESGKITRPHLRTLLKIARALGAEVEELRESGKVQAPLSSIQPPLNGFEEERRLSILAAALITVTEQWQATVSNPNATAYKISFAVDAALDLCDALAGQVEPSATGYSTEQWTAIRLAARLLEISKVGNERVLGVSGEEEQYRARREQMRELTRRISA
jgi:transcriptional regulator with XRE-family HTH domain